MVDFVEIPHEYNFSSVFDTFILAFCPDTDSWFATNQRFFFYEYPKEFPSEDLAIKFFKENPNIFLDLENKMNINRPSFNNGGVWLGNTKDFITIKV